LVIVTIDEDGDGTGDGEITSTAGHAYWTAETVDGDGYWAPARDLVSGAWLRTSSGTWVQATVITAYTTKTHTYNLTVADFHTYYVTAGNTNALVHNCDSLKDFADDVRNQPGAKFAAEYTSPSGAKYYGRNKHGQQAEGSLADALERAGHHGGCAEVHCLVQAQAAEGPGAIWGGTMRTVVTRNNSMPTSNTAGHGQPAYPCGRCDRLLEDLRIS